MRSISESLRSSSTFLGIRVGSDGRPTRESGGLSGSDASQSASRCSSSGYLRPASVACLPAGFPSGRPSEPTHTTDRTFASGPDVGPCRVSKRRLPRSRTSNQSSYTGRTTACEDAGRFFSGLVRPICFRTKPEGWDSL